MAESDKGLPQVGMIFKSKEEAWLFWVAYGGRVGFEVRKRYTNVNKFDGTVTSCRYVCAKEGIRKKGERESIQKCFRAETRSHASVQGTIS
jgi:zinc finger SWIM domain-containing protein 3